tara:strand:- start:429 stop:1214 length:786 start_codon:yes stop_codon:yes gene_type:complete
MTQSRKLSKKEINQFLIEYRKNGFIKIKNLFELDFLNNLYLNVKKLSKSKNLSNRIENLNLFEDGEISSMHNLSDYISEYKNLKNSPSIVELFNKLYGEISNLEFNSSYFAKPKIQGYATKPHQDNAFFCFNPIEAFTCWIPLDKVTKENGPMYYLVGSSVEGILPHSSEGNLGASQCIDDKIFNKIKEKYKLETTTLNPGDCLIHNPLVIHGSFPNKSFKNRRAFNFSISSKNVKRDDNLYIKYRKNLNCFLNKKKLKEI